MTGHVEQDMPIVNASRSIQSMVRDDLDAREQVGIARYGTPLQAHNGRDALRDAYEEALDLACYLRQAMAERDAFTYPEIGVERPGRIRRLVASLRRGATT